MAEDIIKPNSDKALERTERKHKEPVQVKKKNGFADFIEAIRPKNPNSFLHHIIYDILTTSAVNVTEDILKDGIDHWLHPTDPRYYRDDRYYRRTDNRGGVSYVPYNSIYETPQNSRPYEPNRTPDPRNIVFNDRGTADKVLEEMRGYIYESGFCSIGEFYEIIRRVTEGAVSIPTSYTDETYGWTDLNGVRPGSTYDGRYTIRFPRTEHI